MVIPLNLHFSLFYIVFVLQYGFVISFWSSDIKTKIGIRLKHCLIQTINNVGYIMCVRECQHLSACKSVNYNREHLHCELNWSSVDVENISKVIKDKNYVHVQKKDVQINIFRNCDSATCSSTTPMCIVLRSKQTTCINTEIRTSVEASTNSLITTSSDQISSSVSTLMPASDRTSLATTTSIQPLGNTSPESSTVAPPVLNIVSTVTQAFNLTSVGNVASTQPSGSTSIQLSTTATTSLVTISRKGINWTSIDSRTSSIPWARTSNELADTTTVLTTTEYITSHSSVKRCPSSYIPSMDNTFCLFLSQSKANRDNAKKQCNTIHSGGSLIFINSQDTQNNVEGFLSSASSSSNDYVWIDGKKGSSWTSSTGATMAYFNWENSWSGISWNKKCIKLKIASGKWRSNSCSSTYKYICRTDFI